jgi:hypothetical protein
MTRVAIVGKNFSKKCFLFLVVIGISVFGFLSNASASVLPEKFFDPLDGNFDASQYLTENAYGFLPVPVVITEPAVEGGLGLMGLFFHEDEEAIAGRKKGMQSENAAKYLIPPSVSVVGAAYTGNGSYAAGLGHLGFFKQGKIRYSGGFVYSDIDLDYYNVGDIALTKPLSISTKGYGIFQTVKFKTGDLPLYVGPIQRYIKADLTFNSALSDSVTNLGAQNFIDELGDFLAREVTTSGLGVGIDYDTRDNIFTPTKGAFYELSYVAYRDSIGSDIEYDWYRLDGQNYFQLNPDWRAGIHIVAEVADTNERLPPFAMPGINMRGIPAARYQGSHMATLEGEVTWQMNYRWSVLGFAGAGRAANSSSDFSAAGSQLSKGVGFRYLIAKQYGFNMGLDVARGPEDTVWYIQAGSAW